MGTGREGEAVVQTSSRRLKGQREGGWGKQSSYSGRSDKADNRFYCLLVMMT